VPKQSFVFLFPGLLRFARNDTKELLGLLVEKVFYNGQSIEILTIIPLGEQLYPIHEGDKGGEVTIYPKGRGSGG